MPNQDFDTTWEDQPDSSDTTLNQDTSVEIPFHSTTGNITGVAYNYATQTLYVSFKNPATYRYDDVPAAVAEGFSGASSATLYLNDQIVDRFSYEEL